jgi:hypothetical protein
MEENKSVHTKSEAPAAEQIETSEKQVSKLHVDVEEHGHAVKGDDSDGVIQWTPKHAIASLSLAGLYVGRYLSSKLAIYGRRHRLTAWTQALKSPSTSSEGP